jgi:uncharacterized membrane protein YjjB (DUF3815 family)
MTAIPPILVQIQADVTSLKQGLAQAQAAIKGVDDNVKVADTGMKNFTSRLKNVASTLGVAFAGTQIAAFAKDTVMAASNMAESLSKVRVVFGEGAAAVEAWGKTAADSMGISNQAALEAAGTYGNLFQAFGLGQGQAQDMSMSLVQLASDMASFNNTSIDDAITALRSGLSGETEPLKKFGVAMNEARLKTEALSLGLIKSTSDALTPAAKAQAAYALIMKDTALAQGDYARTADGTANTMKTLQAKMEDAKVALGDALMPAFQGLLAVLKVGIPLLQKLGNFFKNNQDEIKAFAIVLGIGATAWGVYTLAVKRAEIAQKLLNLAQKANPIGLIITAVALLAAGMVKLWKNSETFRNVVISVGKAGLTAFASIIPMVGKVGEAVLKFLMTPLKTVLTALSKLPGVGKYAKTGLDLLNKGLDGVSDFADKAAAKANSLIKTLDNVGKAKAKAEKDVTTTTKGGKTTTTATVDAKTLEKAAKEEQKRLDKLKDYAKDVEDIYKDMNDVITEAQERGQEALETRNERMAEAQERYNETVADLNKRYAEAIADAEERAAEARADAQDNYRKAETEARKRFAAQQIQIAKQYNDKVADLEKALQNKLRDIQESANSKRAELTQKAAEKQAGIVQQSMDRLRSAFASKTGFNLGEAMAGGKSADALLADLKSKLAAAKELQANAAALAGMGYSQTFIEQVVKNGPEAGNKIAEALKAASPDATKELQLLYGQVETVSETGLDALAKTMNEGGKLATSELMEAYTQVATDLRVSLTEVDRQMQDGLAEAQAAYASAMTEAKAERDARMTEAMTQMNESIAEAKAALEAALAEAEKTLAKSRAEAQKRLNEGLAEAQKTLQKSLEDAQKAYEKAIDEINKSTQKKLADLKAKLAEVAAQMAALQAAQAAQAAMASAPVYTPIVPRGAYVEPSGSGSKTGTTTNVTQNFTATAVDTQLVSTATVSAIRFGNVIVPTSPTALASRESGAIGAASIASRTTQVKTASGGGAARGSVML